MAQLVKSCALNHDSCKIGKRTVTAYFIRHWALLGYIVLISFYLGLTFSIFLGHFNYEERLQLDVIFLIIASALFALWTLFVILVKFFTYILK